MKIYRAMCHKEFLNTNIHKYPNFIKNNKIITSKWFSSDPIHITRRIMSRGCFNKASIESKMYDILCEFDCLDNSVLIDLGGNELMLNYLDRYKVKYIKPIQVYWDHHEDSFMPILN